MSLVTSSERPTLLTLPIELRSKIFGYLLDDDDGHSNWITAETPYKIDWSGDEHNILSLLLVCKQFQNEVAPLVYRTVVMGHFGFELTMWQDFFQTIGPTNAGLIKDVSIFYHCEQDVDYFQHAYGLNYPWTSADLWCRLFETMWAAGVQPRRVDVDVLNCASCVFVQRELEHCDTWNDLNFLRSLSWLLGKAERVTLSRDFNPLWVYALKARFGLQTTCRGRGDVERIVEEISEDSEEENPEEREEGNSEEMDVDIDVDMDVDMDVDVEEESEEESDDESDEDDWEPQFTDFRSKGNISWLGTLFSTCSKSHYENHVVLEIPDKE